MTSRSTTLGPSAGARRSLDLATLLKASQAIAGEIVLERLLASSWTSSCENAGAESVGRSSSSPTASSSCKPSKTAGAQPRVHAGGAVAATSVALLDRHRELRAAHVASSSSSTTRHSSGNSATIAYVQPAAPKSVLCAPVVHKGTLIGALYLENNQVTGAFTPDRLEALNILMSQIAVSIENATLYARQEHQAARSKPRTSC